MIERTNKRDDKKYPKGEKSKMYKKIDSMMANGASLSFIDAVSFISESTAKQEPLLFINLISLYNKIELNIMAKRPISKGKADGCKPLLTTGAPKLIATTKYPTERKKSKK